MKTPLILLHGALGSSDQMEQLAANLSDLFDVHTFNFEGHGGRSSSRDFSMQVFVENVLGYMDAHSIQQANFFGYSMGGYVAMHLALNHPEQVGKIFTYGTKFHWTPESSEKEVTMLDPDKILEKVPQFAALLSDLHGEDNWKQLLRKTGEMMLALGNGKAFSDDQLRSIETHVQLSIGTKDHMVSIEETQRVAGLLPNGKLQVLENWSHPVEKLDTLFLQRELTAYFKT